ncbi:hypothetical protein T261_4569 [Streptomyces lydicus]|nr:hypothetical protein T261_4569 [Streptomyces lydicus]
MRENTATAGNTGTHAFDNLSHETLYSMVANGDPGKIEAMGVALTDAGSEIAKITKDLEGYVGQVHWEGDGAEAFRKWTTATAKESHKLAQFARTAGEEMTVSAGALNQAKNMPKPPPPKNLVETHSATVRSGLETLSPDRQEAINAMTRLASYYSTAQEKIERQAAPNFEPASGFVPGPERGNVDIIKDSYVLDRRTTSSTPQGTGGTGPTTSRNSSGSEQYAAPSRSASDDVHREGKVSTSVDSTAPVVLPKPPQSPGNASPSQPDGSEGSRGPGMPSPVTTPAGKLKVPNGRESRSPSPQPITGRTGRTPGQSRTSPGDGIVGGTAQRGGTTAERSRLPSGTVMGEEHGAIPPRSAGPTGNAVAPRSEPAAGRAGSSGQRPIPTHGQAMGEQHGPMTPGSTGGSFPGRTGATGRVPSGSGNRLSYEPGGTVGAGSAGPVVGGEAGRPGMPSPRGRSSALDPAAKAGHPHTSHGRTSEFTSGGSGLTRSAPSSGMLPMSGAPSSRSRKRSSSQRPEYLQEDDETWTAQHPPVMPPVIE